MGERPTSSASDALAAALRLLTRRGHSEAELDARLRRKGFTDEQVADALQRCRQFGYLDDTRFARERARALMRDGRAVGRSLLADLARRGVAEATARAALEEAVQEYGEETLLGDLRRRRFPAFSWQQADDRQRQRVVNYFLRRGFPLALTLSILKDENDER